MALNRSIAVTVPRFHATAFENDTGSIWYFVVLDIHLTLMVHQISNAKNQHVRSKKPPNSHFLGAEGGIKIFEVFPSCLPTHDILNDKISNSHSTTPGHHFYPFFMAKPWNTTIFITFFMGFLMENSPFWMLRTPQKPRDATRCPSFDTKPAGRRMALKTTPGSRTESSGAQGSKVWSKVGRAGMEFGNVWDKAYFILLLILLHLTSVIWFFFDLSYTLKFYESWFFWPDFGEYPVISPQS